MTAFKALLQMFLSAEGYQKVDEITVLAEGFLSTKNPKIFGPNKYHISLFGDPTNSGSWGFQLDGHHCAINFLVHGDNVSMVPAFMGSEPIVGTFNNISFDIFKDERDMGLSLYHGLSSDENTAATSSKGEAKLQVGPPSIKGVYGLFAQIINKGGVRTLYEHYMSADHHIESQLFFDYKVKTPHINKHEHGHLHSHSKPHTHG